MLFMYNPSGLAARKPSSVTSLLKYSIVWCICILLFPAVAPAVTNNNFSVAHIDPQLLVNANIIVREYSVDMQLTAAGEVYVKKHIAITVLNEKGMKHASFGEDFSKLKRIQKIGGAIYDKEGNQVERLKASDFISTSLNPETGFYSDDKIMFFMCPGRSFPFTITYNVETKQQHTFFIPDFLPQQDDGCAVELAALTVSVPAGQQLRYRSLRTNATPVKTVKDDMTVYSWQMKKMRAVIAEPLSRNSYYDRPGILLAAAHFRLNDYEGSTESWQEIGRFIYRLNKDRDVLPESEQQKIKQLVADIGSTAGKIQTLYKYLQNNFRYVAVEYGIGGWQTLDAAFLAKNRYGDCKALTNYMAAMLHTAGIIAYPVLINAGVENKMEFPADFPGPRFNHVILCVPAAKDTTWLECTSNELPAGYLSDFTQNRYGLMITPDGGTLVRTPVYDTATNQVRRHAVVRLLPEGKLHVVMDNEYLGQPAVALHHQVNNKSAHDLDMQLEKKYNLPGYTVTSYNYKRADSAATMGMDEHIEMEVVNMATAAGGRTLVNLDVAPLKNPLPVLPADRTQPFYLPGSYACTDSFEWIIPGGMSAE